MDLVVLNPKTSPFGLADKRAALAGYLSTVRDSDELVLFTDGYDALFIRDERHIMAAYASFSEPVVFSAEVNPWPLGIVGLALHDGPPVGRFPYLNSGGFIGPARMLHALITRYPEPPTGRFELLRQLRAHGYDTDRRFGWSDQYHWTLVRLLERETTGVDHDARLFECYAPPVPDVNFREIMREVEDFRARGRESDSYQRERTRLAERLQVPSGAAHIHFASPVTKAVAEDLLHEGQLPGWLIGHLSTAMPPAQVLPV
ncbi:glycosyltransferase domain-containing protein [Phytohabitans rumicis]|nr:glycosyltransferase domain-containing protein [Phytohabitans rumicis]